MLEVIMRHVQNTSIGKVVKVVKVWRHTILEGYKSHTELHGCACLVKAPNSMDLSEEKNII